MCSDFFFFKQKTAYEMRISDWSSDVCSSDLSDVERPMELRGTTAPMRAIRVGPELLIAQDKLTRNRFMKQWNREIEAGAASSKQIGPTRSEERRVGKECVSTCRSRWAPDH